jgi:alkanesulfonate monooxygenase SsuD/methylene tetrahydromethanopterin reductase-like flavin-dependent oxidoreductase (luciferase family)
MWEEALQVSVRAMTEEPFTGFKGQYVDMPPRNVVPKPVQKPHPPLWVACTRPSTVHMAAEQCIGALSFAYTGPEALGERVRGYYQAFEERGAPRVPMINPNVLAIGGDLSMMVAPTDEEAVKRLGIGGGFFSFGILHYYMTGQHTPGKTGVWDLYRQAVEADPAVAYGPGRGAIGSPETVREFLRGYEASGVDEIILLLNPRSHEGTMESIELMGKQVLPEFIDRHEKAVAEKAKRLAPVIERVEARRRPWTVPELDPGYAFGGLPTGRGGSFTAQEIPEAMAEIEEGQKQAAERAKASPK